MLENRILLSWMEGARGCCYALLVFSVVCANTGTVQRFRGEKSNARFIGPPQRFILKEKLFLDDGMKWGIVAHHNRQVWHVDQLKCWSSNCELSKETCRIRVKTNITATLIGIPDRSRVGKSGREGRELTSSKTCCEALVDNLLFPRISPFLGKGVFEVWHPPFPSNVYYSDVCFWFRVEFLLLRRWKILSYFILVISYQSLRTVCQIYSGGRMEGNFSFLGAKEWES